MSKIITTSATVLAVGLSAPFAAAAPAPARAMSAFHPNGKGP